MSNLDLVLVQFCIVTINLVAVLVLEGVHLYMCTVCSMGIPETVIAVWFSQQPHHSHYNMMTVVQHHNSYNMLGSITCYF